MPRKASAEYNRNRKHLIYDLLEKCAQCGEDFVPRLQVDHIKPVAEGGTDSLDNLQVLCHNCHKKKTAAQLTSPEYKIARQMRALNSPASQKWWIFRRTVKKEGET